jgi:hypothetical protein
MASRSMIKEQMRCRGLLLQAALSLVSWTEAEFLLNLARNIPSLYSGEVQQSSIRQWYNKATSGCR